MNNIEANLLRALDELSDLQAVSFFENVSSKLVAGANFELLPALNELGEQSDELHTFAETTLNNLEFAIPRELMAASARIMLRDLARREELQAFLQDELSTYSDPRQIGELSDLVLHLGVAASMVMFALNTRFRFSYDRANGVRVELAAGDTAPVFSPGASKSASSYIDAVRGIEQNLRCIKIFVASSKELLEHRDQFELEFRRYNDFLIKRKLFIQILRWETGPQAVARTRLQDTYNDMVKNSDVVVCLFATKTGKYTEEEFDTAYSAMQRSKDSKPFLFTYFQSIDADQVEPSLLQFREKLRELGHFEPVYSGIADLVNQFRRQLDSMIEDGKFNA